MRTNTHNPMPPPPAKWLAVRRMAERVAAPVEQFLALETSGGLLLLAAAAVALVWANSPWSHSYHELWHTPITLGVNGWTFRQDLHFWINEFLMTIFFLVVGLEIKREIVEGELSDLRRAALPIGAAIGGMLVPAGIYLALNPTGPTTHGWGVPMATDIAFAVGVLQLLGKRVPASMRVLLLALAIIDDIGAIIVIALFYSSGISATGLAITAGALVVLITFRRTGVRPGAVYWFPLLLLWIGLYVTGVHPTLAGVIVGLTVPVKPWLDRDEFERIARDQIGRFRERSQDPTADDHDVLAPLRTLSAAGREAASPAARAIGGFHPWVAFLIMPLFALANAGVNLGGVQFSAEGATTVLLGVGLGLVLGKPLGIVGITWLFTRLGLCRLPRGVTWGGITVLGLVAGIGFTMSIFIAELAFVTPEHLGIAKLAILGATAVAAIGGLMLGRLLLAKELAPDIARMTPAEAETSTDY